MPSRVDAVKAVATSTLVGSKDTQGHLKEPSYRATCGKCGARRIDRQIGLEATPAAFVAEMVAVFREVRRVLRDDGTVWLNLGDSYASSWPCNRRNVVGQGSLPNGKREARPERMGDGLKEKDLMGIPWRVAFALQDDGWYLRSDIVWAKPNPMPESVTDRPTRSHEYIFLLSKSARYFYDGDSVREESVYVWNSAKSTLAANGKMNVALFESGERRTAGAPTFHRDENQTGRNKRDVWTVATAPYAEAHFATFPPKLIEPCVLAGAPAGGVVLDPFAGAGTSLLVAKNLGRAAIGIELNPDYCQLIVNRLRQGVLPLSLSPAAPGPDAERAL